MRQYYDLLAETPLFAGFSAAEIAALLGPDAVERPFARGEVLGGVMPALAFVLEGSALVYKASGDDTGLLMSRLLPGRMFGMASLFSPQADFPTEIRAEQAGRLLLWPKAAVEAAIAADARLALGYIALLSERIHFLNRRIETLTGDDLRTRLLRVLEGLRADAPAGDGFTLPFSLSQLAAHLGVGRASLYRALDALEAEGLLRREGTRDFTIIYRRASQNE